MLHTLLGHDDGASLLLHRYSYHSMTLLYADFGKLPGFVVLTLDNCSMQ